MQILCHSIATWSNGHPHAEFHILCEDEQALIRAVETIMKSSMIDYFEVDGKDGNELYKRLDEKLYGYVRRGN